MADRTSDLLLTADGFSGGGHADLGAKMMTGPSCRLKMILFLGFAAILLTLVPRPGAAQDVRTLCQPVEMQDGTPQEEPCLKFGSLDSVAKRDGGVLTLKLNNGKTKVISDSKECEDPNNHPENEGKCIDHALVGYIGDRFFLVHVQPWECGYPLLVSRRTGKEMKLENWPNLSPDKKRFVVVTPFEECIVHDTIAIFSLDSDPPRLEWTFSPDNNDEDYGFDGWGFDGWDGDNRVRLHTYFKGKQIATDLKLTAWGWQIKRPNGKYRLGVPARANSKDRQPSPPTPPP